MRRAIVVLLAGLVAALAVAASASAGFDQYGYNRQARIFNGPVSGWCLNIGLPADCVGNPNDRLVMKWNALWDQGNADGWSNPAGYAGAWTTNEWNGAVPGGSGSVWHYKIVWVGTCGADGTPLPDGGYCIWGQFDVVMDQGTFDGVHSFLTRATPNGLGGGVAR